MKKAYLIIGFVLIAGLLFFSCSMVDPHETGTLIIRLPGNSSARAAGDTISDSFMKTLTYEIECRGVGTVKKNFKFGDSVSIPLAAGDWTVTVTVRNAAGQNINFGEKTNIPVTIKGGETTYVNDVTIRIDTSRCDITEFKITNPLMPAATVYTIGGNTITITVPYNYSISGSVTFTATHTGVSIDPAPGTVSWSSLDNNGITVTAENGTKKTYFLTVTEEELPPGGNGTFTLCENWNDVPWGTLGLSGISAPGTVIDMLVGIPPEYREYILESMKTEFSDIPYVSAIYMLKLEQVNANSYPGFVASIVNHGYTQYTIQGENGDEDEVVYTNVLYDCWLQLEYYSYDQTLNIIIIRYQNGLLGGILGSS
jgi:hypothetical protein